MNAVSQAILDVAWSPEPSTFALNLVHPRPISWNQMLSFINEAMVTEGVVGSRIPTIPYQAWCNLLEKHAAESSEDVLKDVVSCNAPRQYGNYMLIVPFLIACH